MSTHTHSTYLSKWFQYRASPFFFDDPGAVSPEQFYSLPAEVDKKMRGEVALMYAVLEDALNCFQQSGATRPRAQRLAREAEEWFFTDDHHWPFSFVNICAAVGLDPEHIRKGLKHQPRRSGVVSPKKKRRMVLPRWSIKVAA